jgi:predicted DNA-binding transcriptional regulator AlpA
MEPNLHIDKRADTLIPALSGDEDVLLSTRDVAQILGVSVPWVEIARSKGYGPPFIRIGVRGIRYRKDALRAWLKERAEYRCTRDCGTEAA